MKILQGVIHGRTIELEGDPGFENGRTVEVVLQEKRLPELPYGWKPRIDEIPALSWTEEDDRIFEEIHIQRKASFERGYSL